MAKSIRKREQFLVLIVSSNAVKFMDIQGVGQVPYVEVRETDYVPMSENAVFRNPLFHDVVEIEQDGITKQVKIAKFLVFENKVDPKKDLVPQEVLLKGLSVFFVDKQGNSLNKPSIHFARVMRSASQYRSGKFLMSHADIVHDVRDKATYGWINSFVGQKIIKKKIAKIEPYASLALTSTLSAGTGWTSIDIEDYTATVDITGALCVDSENQVIAFDEYLRSIGALAEDAPATADLDLTDGQILISPYACAKVSMRIGQINSRAFKMIESAFAEGIMFNEQLWDDKLRRIWSKISRGLQMRFGIKKGFAVVMDHGYIDPTTGELYDLVFPTGAIKGHVESVGTATSDVELCIANISTTEEKSWGKLNYQFIQATDLTFNELKGLADIAIKKVVNALQSPEHAMQFIGMICNDEEMYEEENATTKLRSLLSANSKIFHTRWVQAQIKKLMEKTILDMRFGRIPVEDSRFSFIVTDPQTLIHDMPMAVLDAGEFYYNGREGTATIFRSPLIHKSEPVVINCVSNPYLDEMYGHLNNILVMNARDDSLPRMGGADTDGDKVYIVFNDVINNSIESLPLVFGDTEGGNEIKSVEYEWGKDGFNAIFEYDLDTLLPSKIGLVTNYCTTLVDIARDPRTDAQSVENAWNMVIVGRVTQGKIIDDAKRGTETTIPDALKQAKQPHWLKDCSCELVELNSEKVYHSQAPMGNLYDYISVAVKKRLNEYFGEVKKYSVNLLNSTNYDPNEANEILPHIELLEQRYRQDMATFMQENPDLPLEFFDTKEAHEDFKEDRSARLAALIERHRDILKSVDANPSSIAVAALHVAEYAEGRGTKAISYPYVVATDFVCALLKTTGNFKLVAVHAVDDWYWADTLYVREGKGFNYEAYPACRTDLPEGEYETFTYDDRYFLKVPVESEVVDTITTDVKKVQFTLKAWKQYAEGAETAEELKALINCQTVEVHEHIAENGEWLALVLNGRKLATAGQESWITVSHIKQRKLTVTNVQIYKGIVKVDAEVIGDAPKVEFVEPTVLRHNSETPSDYTWEFDMTVGM